MARLPPVEFDSMKIAATVVLFVATLFVADNMFSGESVGDSIKSDFLELDRAAETPTVSDADNEEESVIDGWLDTLRRRRTRRQSRFC